MSTMNAAPAVVCEGCNRKFAWKPELAGKRVRCKCGHAITIPGGNAAAKPAVTTRQAVVAKPPSRPAPPTVVKPPTMVKPLKPREADALDALAALAADAEQKVAELPVEVREAPVLAPAAAPAKRRAGTVAPPGFRARPAERAKADRIAALNDPVRDHYVPSILLAVGVLIYAGFICFQYHLGSVGLAPVIIGVSLMGTIKTALLVGGAFVLAGPLGVGFGDLKSAILKLAAISVFSDGVSDWVDHGIATISGGHHGGTGIGFGALGWAVSVAIYWAGMVYLFSMDIADARLVVVCLGIGSRIIRVVVILILYSALVGNGPTMAYAPAGPVGPTIRASTLSTRVDELKLADRLSDARAYIAKGNQ